MALSSPSQLTVSSLQVHLCRRKTGGRGLLAPANNCHLEQFWGCDESSDHFWKSVLGNCKVQMIIKSNPHADSAVDEVTLNMETTVKFWGRFLVWRHFLYTGHTLKRQMWNGFELASNTMFCSKYVTTMFCSRDLMFRLLAAASFCHCSNWGKSALKICQIYKDCSNREKMH